MISIDRLKKKFLDEKEKTLQDFFTLLRFPTIATDPKHAKDVTDCARWLQNYLHAKGIHVDQWQTKGAPVLFATIDAKKDKTLLLYSHYDVQPVDPLDLWTTPPFEPTLRDHQVFARGASDDKGQTFYTLLALSTLLDELKTLPVNIKWVIEGEEESGSGSLAQLLAEKKQELKADYLLVIDAGMPKEGTPAITLGARGLVAMTVTMTGSNSDFHSGELGGIAYNPNRALIELLATLHDKEGRVTIPGFYDEVLPISASDKKELSIDFDEKDFSQTFNALATGMERGFLPHEAAWLRPTLEINGISGGYSGPGFKTVIPAMATAKISCRLVCHQDPEKISHLVKEHLLSHVPGKMKIQVEIHPGGGRAFRSSPDSALATALTKALEEVFSTSCQRILIGGSIPIISELSRVSQAETLLFGVGLSSDLIHAPNEHFGLDRLEQGYLSIARMIQLL